jgi:L-histidine Nalpha-methyltransferase
MSPSPAGRAWSEPAGSPFAADLIAGLTARPKRIAPKHFYDAPGSALFEQITRLPEYYPTRTELRILEEQATALAGFIPPGATLVEFGSGSSAKVRRLLAGGSPVATYVPVDISAEFLNGQADQLARDVPGLRVLPVAADFTQPFRLPGGAEPGQRVGFFPGSTIGNFEPADAEAFLVHAGAVLGPGSGLIIGVDLVKAPELLHAAYNDAAGITAAFNRNVLARANRELGAEFDLASFRHHAFYNAAQSRIEMHLVSRLEQVAQVCGRSIPFGAGESIHTENSYKYTIETFRALAQRAGWSSVMVWSDADRLFSVHALRYAGHSHREAEP